MTKEAIETLNKQGIIIKRKTIEATNNITSDKIKTITEPPINVIFDITIRYDYSKERHEYQFINPIIKSSINETTGIKELIIQDNNNGKIVDQKLLLKDDFKDDIITFLSALSNTDNDVKKLYKTYSLYGLKDNDRVKIVHGLLRDPIRYIYISLYINIYKDNFVDYISIWFNNDVNQRISSIKTVYGYVDSILSFNDMLIGPDAPHPEEDQTVLRTIKCRYCGEHITTSTYSDYFNHIDADNICENCKDISRKNTEEETRTYKITGYKEQLDTLEVLFSTIKSLGEMGSSRSIEIYVDGDGAVRLNIESNKELSKKAAGYGEIKKAVDGYVNFIDLG